MDGGLWERDCPYVSKLDVLYTRTLLIIHISSHRLEELMIQCVAELEWMDLSRPLDRSLNPFMASEHFPAEMEFSLSSISSMT